MFLKNSTTDIISLIDSNGLMTVATPGLSLINGSALDIEQSIESSQIELEVLGKAEILSMSVAGFGRLISSQMTLEALQALRSMNGLKVGSRAFLEAVAA